MPRKTRLTAAAARELDAVRQALRGAPIRIVVELGAAPSPARTDLERRAARLLTCLLLDFAGDPVTVVLSEPQAALYATYRRLLPALQQAMARRRGADADALTPIVVQAIHARGVDLSRHAVRAVLRELFARSTVAPRPSHVATHLTGRHHGVGKERVEEACTTARALAKRYGRPIARFEHA